MPEELRLIVSRPDIANPDSANATAFLRFEAVSDHDVEMSVTWGDNDRSRGVYLIPRAAAEASEIGGQSRTAGCNTRRLCCGPRYRR